MVCCYLHYFKRALKMKWAAQIERKIFSLIRTVLMHTFTYADNKSVYFILSDVELNLYFSDMCYTKTKIKKKTIFLLDDIQNKLNY